MVLRYGSQHADLAPFLCGLRGLRPQPSASPVGALAAAPELVGLPAAPVCVGRDTQLSDLVAAMLAAPPRPMPVLGGPGIGKTTLALAALHDARVAERFGARRWFVRCDGASAAATLLAGIGNEIDVTGNTGGGPLLPRLRAVLGQAPSVLVLDNLETPW